ncbi:MAG: AAA family ATPase [Desulfurococcaceae archaeon]
MLFILVTGMPGSGKGLVVEVAREMGLRTYSLGDVVREIAMETYGEVTSQNLLATAISIREKFGLDIVARRILERIDKNVDIVVIDGVRSLEEVRVFERFGSVIIIAIHSSPKTRFERLRKRGRAGDPEKWEDFVKRDMIELSLGIGNVIALADYMVVNEYSVDRVKNEIRNILSNIVGGRFGKS